MGGKKIWLGSFKNPLIRQMAEKSGVIKHVLLWNSQRETYNLCKSNPITKCLRNRCEDKGKPDRTSIRYGMKLCHHCTRNRHGMSTHPRRVCADRNLPKSTTSVCAVYVPLPLSNCRLCIPIKTQTVVYWLVNGLSAQATTPTEHMAWKAITNCCQSNYASGNAHAMSELDKSTLFSESELLMLSNLEFTFCNHAEFKRFSRLFINAN